MAQYNFYDISADVESLKTSTPNKKSRVPLSLVAKGMSILTLLGTTTWIAIDQPWNRNNPEAPVSSPPVSPPPVSPPPVSPPPVSSPPVSPSNGWYKYLDIFNKYPFIKATATSRDDCEMLCNYYPKCNGYTFYYSECRLNNDTKYLDYQYNSVYTSKSNVSNITIPIVSRQYYFSS